MVASSLCSNSPGVLCQAGFPDVLQSSCYIHMRNFGSTPGFSDSSARLCAIATFAAVHNCSVIVPFFSETSSKKHAVPPYWHQRIRHEKVSWSRYVDLQSDSKIPGSRAILEASWPDTLLQHECHCLSPGGWRTKRMPPCPHAMACPRLLGKRWRWRSYDSFDSLKELVRQLHLDLRKESNVLRVYSYGMRNSTFYRPLGGALNVFAFLAAASEKAVRLGLSQRRDLVDVRKHKLVRRPTEAVSLQGLAIARLQPCGRGPSEEVRNYVAAQLAAVLGGKPFAHLLLRRGDRVKQFPKCSAAANVARAFLLKLQQARPRPLPMVLLVHSNEADPEYWRELLQGLRGSFETVVTERELPNPYHAENYFAYAAALLFAKQASFAMHFHPDAVLPYRQEICPEGA